MRAGSRHERTWALRLAGAGLQFFASLIFTLAATCPVSGWEWIPSDEDMLRYRNSWNPLSNGPMMIPSVDIQPKGQITVHPYLFGQISEKRFGNDLTTDRSRLSTHTYAIAPLITSSYGITDHVELTIALTESSFWTRDSTQFNQGQGGPVTTNTGLGDLTIYFKYRPIVQDPSGWRPSLTTYNQIVLPTSQWITGTEKPPGGFQPLGRLPATRFGAMTWTEGLMFRKNLRPFRISGGVFYSYHLPGREMNMNTYPADVINTRLAFEHILDDKKGFGYGLEFIGLHGLPWRADGHAMNRGFQHGFNSLGIEPMIQYRLSENWVAAGGVLYTVAGQNTLDGIYPNFSIYWYWSEKGKVQMR